MTSPDTVKNKTPCRRGRKGFLVCNHDLTSLPLTLRGVKNLRAGGMPAREAAVKAAMKRLRAVLLTSITTIVGILPILFETALEAQFLKPMVVSLTFGLLFGTLIVLLLLPAFLTGIESLRQLALRVRSDVGKLIPDPRLAVNASRARRLTREDPAASPGTRGQET